MTALFPSRTVAWYMARMFLVRTFGIMAGITLILLALNLLGEAGKILAVKGNTDAQVWHYAALRGPQIMAFILPFSVLLGTILTFLQMNQNSEIIALKAGGMSAHQVLAPLLVASLGVAAISFAFNDRVVAPGTAMLNQWSHVDYGPLPVDTGDRTNVWVRSGNDLIQVDMIHGRGDAAQLRGVTVYERNADGGLRGLIFATAGRRDGDGWLVGPTRRFEVATGRVTPGGAITIGDGVTPDQFTLATVDPDGLSFAGLRAAISDLKDSGRPTKSLEGALWHKLSGPLSAVLMPLLGAVAAFGIARSGQLFVRAVAGMALGFTYFVADNFALAMGNLGAYPPFLAAWAPFLLFLMIGEAVLLRSEE